MLVLAVQQAEQLEGDTPHAVHGDVRVGADGGDLVGQGRLLVGPQVRDVLAHLGGLQGQVPSVAIQQIPS